MSNNKYIGVESLIGYKLKRTQHILRLCMDEELKFLELTTPQYSVLAQAELNPGISSAVLAKSAFITPQTMNQIVLNLEKRGLIFRQNCARNQRILCTELTDKGKHIVSQAHEIIKKCEMRMMSTFSSENKILFEKFLLECFDNLNKSVQ